MKLHQASMLELKERFSLTSRYRTTSPAASPEAAATKGAHSRHYRSEENEGVDIAEVAEAITASRPVSQTFSVHAMSDITSLLSPISISLAPPATSRLLQFEACHREDSIDSGYAENEPGPTHTTPPLPSPRRLSNVSTLSLLSSPFGSASSRVLSPTFGPSSSAAWPASTLFSAGSELHAETATEEAIADPFDDLDSPSDYHLRRSSNTRADPVSDTELTATVKPPSTPSLPDEGFDEEPLSHNGPLHVDCFTIPVSGPSRPSSRASQGSFLERYYAEQGSPSVRSSSPSILSPTSPRPPVFSKLPRAGPLSLRISVSRSPPLLQAELASDAPPLSAVAPSIPTVAKGQRPSGIVSAPTSAVDLQRRESKKVPFGFRHAAAVSHIVFSDVSTVNLAFVGSASLFSSFHTCICGLTF